MKYLEIIDMYDENKIWCIKVYSKGEVYFNQKNSGIMKNSKFQRTTKKWLNEILERNINVIIANDEREDEPDEYLSREDGTLHIVESHKDAYVELFSNIHSCENNPYIEEDEADIF